MKRIISKYIGGLFIVLIMVSCESMETINTDPNNPAEVPSNMLFSGAQKKMIDYVYDNWFSGRQCLVYSQYWAQRNYTEEDRYQIRESVNNNYFNHFYTLTANMTAVIKLNTDPETASISSMYGNNNNQIAAAKIMRAWMFSIITDTWGDIPYTETGKLIEDQYYPKYDDQAEVYESLIAELTEASKMIDESDVAFVGGDMIYNGDAGKWKKFANSLKCRLAIHTSKVQGSKWKQYIAEAIEDGVFESNEDAAAYHYSVTAPEYCVFYEGFYIDARNDFTMTRSFMDILKGEADTLNMKSHPWEAVSDPRLSMYTTPRNGKYIGIPYGIPSSEMIAAYPNAAPNWYANPPAHLQPDFQVPIMTYAELMFILSEYNGFSAEEYKTGVEASVNYWASVSGQTVESQTLSDYVNAVSQTVNEETVALQKYIDLFMNGTEAWTEIRRTGYPTQILQPGEITVGANEAGSDIIFEPLSDTKGLIIARVKYPTNESNYNRENFNDAVSRLEDGSNNYYSPMFWDKRRSEGPHPKNK